MTPEVESARSTLIERMMLTDPSYDASFDRIVRIARSATNSAVAAFTVLDGSRLFLKAHEGMSQREAPREGSFCTHAIEQTGLFIVEDTREDQRFAQHPLTCSGLNFYAGMPICAPSGLPLGTLCVLDQQPHHLDSAQKSTLVDLARSLEESLLLRSLALVDPLTGLFNRRHFEDLVKREWRTGFTAQAPLALMLIDVDHFKRYNDRYGHPAGDRCLRAVADALRSGARRVGDLLARIGGEEFVIVRPRTAATEAREIAEVVRRTVFDLAIPHEDSPLGHVSVSIGVARIADTEAETLDSALQRADDAAYKAKREGRDRVVVAD